MLRYTGEDHISLARRKKHLMNPQKTYTDVSEPPKRQGFYAVQLENDEKLIAGWREYDKIQGKQWWRYVSDEPTAEKKPVLLSGVARWCNAEKAAIDAALKREPTVAERIEEAVKRHQMHMNLYQLHPLAPPANRQLQPGDALELGALSECTVLETRDEGRLVILSHRNIKRERGQDFDCGIAYMAVHWTEVVPTAENRDVTLAVDPVLFDSYRNSTLDGLMSRYLRGLDDNPAYQRDYVWSAEDKQRLLESLFQGREIGRFMFVSNEYPKCDEILDGKQRLSCIWEFFTSQIGYQGVYWHQLSQRDRSRIEHRSVQYADLPGQRYSRADLLRIFLELNAAGVPQTQEHLQRVRQQLDEELARQATA